MSLDAVLDLLVCPHCRLPLHRVDRVVRCPSGHAFDLARSGYLNLLGRAAPANADTAEMVLARDRFLTGGAYGGLAHAIGLLLARTAPDVDAVVEVGAGTGYYLATVLDAAQAVRGVAVDVSPAAARRAARAHDRLGAIMADVWAELPIADGVVDAVLCVFAPRNPAEFARILRPGGVVVIAAPLPDHLAELRSALGLLDIEAGKQDRIASTMAERFEPAGDAEWRARIDLDEAAILDLIAMGPNAFHHERGALTDRIAGLGPPVEVTVAVSITAWRR